MRVHTWLFFVVPFALFGQWSHAELVAICSMERWKVSDPAKNSSETKAGAFEQKEFPLIFEETQPGVYRFKAELNFSFAPNYVTSFEIIETAANGKVEWQTNAVTRRKVGKRSVVAEGWPHEFDDQSGTYGFAFNCDAYQPTGRPIAPAISEREKLRQAFIGPTPEYREYLDSKVTTELHNMGDLHDLTRVILKLPGLNAEIARKTIQDLEKKGFFFNILSLYDVFGINANFELISHNHSCTLQAQGCDTEEFNLNLSYQGPITFTNNAPNLGIVIVSLYGKIYRDTQSRKILGYSLEKVSVVPLRGTVFGGSSSSGGRIMKGQGE